MSRVLFFVFSGGGNNLGYVITNGSKFIRMNSKNRVDSTRSFQDARVFDSLTKANNFAACLPSLFRNTGYEVVNADVFIEAQTEDDCVEHQDEQKQSQPMEINEELLDLEYLLANVEVFEDFIIECKAQKPLIEKEQHKMERVIMDLEHAAELCELDVRRGYMLYKMLHQARKRRRACKDAVTIIAELEGRIDRSMLHKDNTAMIDGFFHRQYTPREIDNIFEIFDSKKANAQEE